MQLADDERRLGTDAGQRADLAPLDQRFEIAFVPDQHVRGFFVGPAAKEVLFAQ